MDPIENYLSSAQQKANNVVYNAGAAGSRIAMEAGQSALNAIGSFRAAYADSLRLTETSLTGQQVIAFRHIRTSMDLLDQAVNGQTDKFQVIADTLAEGVKGIPLSIDIPRVVKVSPIYTVEGFGSSQEFVVHGMGLANGEPVLEVLGGRTIRPNTKTDSELRFSFPAHGPVGTHPLLLATTLRVFERKREYLGLWNEYVPRTYPIRLAIYPREIGRYTITPRRKIPTVETLSVSTPEYRCESPHGKGDAQVPVNIVPTPGWTIVVSSIAYHSNYSNNGHFTMSTTAATGFTAVLSCYGSGKNMFDAGKQGVEHGTFSYIQTREGTTLQNGDTKTMSLNWGDSRTFSDLPADTDTVICELKPFTGQTLDLEGAGSNRFIRLDFNPASKTATVTARRIEESLL
jgi:hypothetical protein